MSPLRSVGLCSCAVGGDIELWACLWEAIGIADVRHLNRGVVGPGSRHCRSPQFR